jgi:hypothetical protein
MKETLISPRGVFPIDFSLSTFTVEANQTPSWCAEADDIAGDGVIE